MLTELQHLAMGTTPESLEEKHGVALERLAAKRIDTEAIRAAEQAIRARQAVGARA